MEILTCVECSNYAPVKKLFVEHSTRAVIACMDVRVRFGSNTFAVCPFDLCAFVYTFSSTLTLVLPSFVETHWLRAVIALSGFFEYAEQREL